MSNTTNLGAGKFSRITRRNLSMASKASLPKLSLLSTAVRLGVLGMGVASMASQAAIIEVNSNLDNGFNCTLRDAITSVNNQTLAPGCANSGDSFGSNNTINIAATFTNDTITLTNGALSIDVLPSLTINGNGVTVDANQQSLALDVYNSTLSLDNIVITGGRDIRSGGGGINVNESSMSLSNSSVLGNVSTEGAGIFANASSVDVINSTISGNVVEALPGEPGYGGGIAVRNGASVNISDSTISGNSARGSGGGIDVRNSSSSVTINNSTLSGNSSSAGGGVFNYNDANIIISHSTLSGNLANFGVSIYNYGGTSLTISNSVIDNAKIDDRFNRCAVDGYHTIDTASIVENSPACIATAQSSIVGRSLDPVIAPLADNGCETKHATPNGQACVMTHALIAGSPAIDSAVASTASTDQIGTARPNGAASDVGAYEGALMSDTSFRLLSSNIGKFVVFQIILNQPEASAVAFDYETIAGVAIDGQDYVGRRGTIVFQPGETVTERRVETLQTGSNAGKTFSLSLTDISDSSNNLVAEGAIISAAMLEVKEVLVREERGRAVVEISLTSPQPSVVRVNYSTLIPNNAPNPAMSGDDFIERRGTIIFQPGETRKTRDIGIINDDIEEPNEVFRFKLSEPVNATIAAGSEQAKIFILNDD